MSSDTRLTELLELHTCCEKVIFRDVELQAETVWDLASRFRSKDELKVHVVDKGSSRQGDEFRLQRRVNLGKLSLAWQKTRDIAGPAALEALHQATTATVITPCAPTAPAAAPTATGMRGEAEEVPNPAGPQRSRKEDSNKPALNSRGFPLRPGPQGYKYYSKRQFAGTKIAANGVTRRTGTGNGAVTAGRTSAPKESPRR